MTDYMNQPLAELKEAVISDGVIDAEEAKHLRQRLYADGIIDREEADFLFAVNDAVSGADNAPSWYALFVDALTSHVLDDEKSPNVLDSDEAAYLIAKVDADGKVDAVELQLLVNICARAQKAPDRFHDYVLAALKQAVLEDGVIDDTEVQMIRHVIYGPGGAGGVRVDRKEADLIFALNDATTGKTNAPAWNDLFVEAITSHVLEDEASPGEVDEAEAAWLADRIQGDQQVDENEKALLTNIKAKASYISDRLAKLIESSCSGKD